MSKPQQGRLLTETSVSKKRRAENSNPVLGMPLMPRKHSLILQRDATKTVHLQGANRQKQNFEASHISDALAAQGLRLT